jgi:acetyltransferase-like isoleucine patch superfamily enzyme
VVFLKTVVTAPNIEVGDYSYYDDPGDPTAFERENVLYAYGPEKLVIGRYCALATGVRFVMAGANHRTAGVSTFPFAIFGGIRAERTLDLVMAVPSRGDTIVGNDVWIGYNAMVMPGVRIGDGAIVAGADPVRRGRCRAVAAGRVVGLAGRAGDRACPHHHGRSTGRDRGDRPRARAISISRSATGAFSAAEESEMRSAAGKPRCGMGPPGSG